MALLLWLGLATLLPSSCSPRPQEIRSCYRVCQNTCCSAELAACKSSCKQDLTETYSTLEHCAKMCWVEDEQ